MESNVIEVILPVHNEIDALPWVLERMPSGFAPLVVDNASTDGSAALAARLGARVVPEPTLGFGSACHAGLIAATSELIAFMDCDASLDPRQLPTVCDPVEEGEADLVIGERRPEPGAWPWHLRVANRVLASNVNRRTGYTLRDLGPMRAARREPLIELAITDRRSGWPVEMVLRAALSGWRITGRATTYAPRRGHSKVTGTPRGIAVAVADMRRVLGATNRAPSRPS